MSFFSIIVKSRLLTVEDRELANYWFREEGATKDIWHQWFLGSRLGNPFPAHV
jgi:hypothetical protein